jgi:FKBP-type peptidyl-prolyl cis-trans isomerase FkpA
LGNKQREAEKKIRHENRNGKGEKGKKMGKMKQSIIGMALVFALGAIGYAEGKVDAASGADGNTSYAFGMVIGSELKETGLTFNYGAFTQGMRGILEDKATDFTMEEALERVQAAILASMAKQAEESREKERAFLEENGKKPEIHTTESGLQYEIIDEGTGEYPMETDTVSAHYRGAFIDGTVFDSSYERGEPAEFPLYAVIPGWAEGLQLMRVGAAYRLFIPSALAYGERGGGSVVPPYATLVFEVELLDILDADEVRGNRETGDEAPDEQP